MKAVHKIALSLFVSLLGVQSANAENYVGVGMGWTINANLKNIKGDENLDYPDPIGTTPGFYYPGSSYSNLSLKDVLQGGIKFGHYFEDYPSLGIELETNYSQPNMKRQNVTISNPNKNVNATLDGLGGTGPYGLGDTISTIASLNAGTPIQGTSSYSMTEDQLPAKVKLLQFNLNALYRYKGITNFTPYIGAGPSLNIIRVTGTGYSGIFVDPAIGDTGCASCGIAISDTSINWGGNFKIGAEYKLNDDWGVAGEYHYNWSNVKISHFRSANNLKADLELQTLNLVLMRHF